ncbi:MAG: pectate lyase [Paludibacteraceae bacterium]|nr:pectate lyase [Paludibacteraceae bacterium]
MDIKNRFILLSLSVMWCMLSACGPGNGEPVTDDKDKQSLDKFTELVAACSDWKQGCGSVATGGEGSATVYRISSLEDKDPYKPEMGTLRYAVEQTGPRVIVFDVAGTIHLKAPLTILNSNLSILGQSAPGQGICVADYPIIIKKANNVILRFIRCRLGTASLAKDPETDYDALSVNDCRNILIDHCSFSWSVDECVSCYGNENFTLQYCFITESLRNAGHQSGAHGYGGIWGGKNATFHHNLLAHHDSRNPRFDHDYVENTCRGPVDFVNNVVYNWGGNSAYGGESVGARRSINFVGNYYKPGPSTKNSVSARLIDPWTKCGNCSDKYSGEIMPPMVWLSGNLMYNSEEVTTDNWKGATTTAAKSDKRFAMATELQIQTAQEAYATVLKTAGCSLSRDAIDARIVSDVENGSGTLIDSPDDAGGWCALDGTSAITDADRDGIDDGWETKYGLDPQNQKDARQVTLVTGFTNLEVYLCDKVKNLY